MNPPDCIFLSIAETNDFSFYGTHIVRTVVCFQQRKKLPIKTSATVQSVHRTKWLSARNISKINAQHKIRDLETGASGMKIKIPELAGARVVVAV